MKVCLLIAAAGLVLLTPAALLALPKPQLDQAKSATALVKVFEAGKLKAYGTAFCIDEAGFFVTNAHVAEGQITLDLVLESGAAGQRVVSAKVLRIDKEDDLALLQATEGTPFPAVPLGTLIGLAETNEILAFGFPFGGALFLDAKDYPAISVNAGHITSLRTKDSMLEVIQVDAVLNPGNSGGPVLDSQGQVIGIVRAGIVGSGVNFAIPVTKISMLLKDAVVQVLPSTLEFAKRSEVQAVNVKVLSGDRPTPAYAVEFTLKAGDTPPRSFNGTCVNGACRLNLALVPPAPKLPDEFMLAATFKEGTIRCRVPNRVLVVGGKQVKLAEIQKIEFIGGGKATVTTSDSTYTGAMSLEGLSIKLGGTVLHPNWSAAQSIAVGSVVEPVHSVGYTLKITRNQATIATLEGVFDLSANAAPPRPSGQAAAAPPVPNKNLAHIPPPAPGQPYTSIAQMLETLPDGLQPPAEGTWTVGLTVARALTQRLAGQPATITGEFASSKLEGKYLEVTFDVGMVDYRGYRFLGQYICRFPLNKQNPFKTARVHDRFSVSGLIDICNLVGDSAFVILKDARLN